jgi:hypothetical protein
VSLLAAQSSSNFFALKCVEERFLFLFGRALLRKFFHFVAGNEVYFGIEAMGQVG